MKTVYLFIGLLVSSISFGQTTEIKLANAVKALENDPQFKHAIISMYVVDSKTGKPVYDKNSQLGLAPASCQKVITSVSAFDILGKAYRYRTEMAFDGTITDSTLNGNLYFISSGDPTLGSWRWSATGEENIKQLILTALKAKNITVIKGDIIIDDSKWESQTTPRGWIWEDIGNYFGAGARGMNWHEDQYDIILKPGKKNGDPVTVMATMPALQQAVLINELKTGPVGSGDRSIIYLPEDATMGYIRGTIPAGKENFTISGAMPNATRSFIKVVEDLLDSNHIKLSGSSKTSASVLANKEKLRIPTATALTIFSPPLDSMNYWFLRESINLYGEALVKTISLEKTKFAATDTGLAIIKDLWNSRGIDRSAMNILDGCGLSPANRVTSNALVTVMQYARQQSWFSSFYNALPEMNGMKMKSGYIGGVRSYTGYIKSKAGVDYTFTIIVNNFDGPPGTVREKMWRLLDILK